MRCVGEADDSPTMAMPVFSRPHQPVPVSAQSLFVGGGRPLLGGGKMEQGRHGIFAHIDRLGSPQGTFFPAASSLDLQEGALVDCTY